MAQEVIGLKKSGGEIYEEAVRAEKRSGKMQMMKRLSIR